MDGNELKEWDLETLRQSIGLVSQSVYLFDGSIWDNILYGRPEASEEEVVEAAKAAEVHEFIETLPQGYQTQIGERDPNWWWSKSKDIDCSSHFKRPAHLDFG